MTKRTPFALSLALSLFVFAELALAQGKDRAEIAHEIELIRAEADNLIARLKEKEKELLAPSEADKKAFADLHAQADVDLIRMLPRGGYELSVNGDGAYYSFTRRTHEYGRGSDIELQDGRFSVGFAGADFGLIVSLGDAPLESVSAATAGIGPLLEFSAPAEPAQARDLYVRSAAGFEVDGRVYKREVQAQVNNTYALRSVVYGESDVLVAFRVVRKDTDGSHILLWKMLRELPKPDLLKMER
jgi:hypothetical protein